MACCCHSLASPGLWGCFVYDCLSSLSSCVGRCLSWIITGCKLLTHHCTLYSSVSWSSLSMHRTLHWYNFIYKSILGLLPTYLSTYMSRKQCCLSLCSQGFITFSIPSVHTEFGKKAFSYSAPPAWNTLQQELKLSSMIPLGDFKLLLRNLERASMGDCTCT